jgi:hypothetical protein
MEEYKELIKCPITLSDDAFTYLDFGLMPLVNNLNDTKEESLNCPRYPLIVNYYPKSSLSMLSVAVDPNILFSHYVYKSGTSQPYIQHCREMYNYICQFIRLNDGDKFVDVGGNDGTLLSTFRDMSNSQSLKFINVDPSKNLGEISRQKGIETITAMWDYEQGNKLDRSCKVITSTNVFQHLSDISGFLIGIWHALADDGIWCLEFPYWGHDLETNQYDQAYHEHIYYYLLTPLVKLFEMRGLEIIDVSKQKIHGGSLRIISRKLLHYKKMKTPESLVNILKEEEKFTIDFYSNWGNNMMNNMIESKEFISTLKSDGYTVAGFGAAAKGCTFLNATKLHHEYIDYVVDDTDTKQGKFIPGVGIPIVSREHLIANPPDYILILAHNFADYIMKSLRPIYNGKFIVMFPRPTIYE